MEEPADTIHDGASGLSTAAVLLSALAFVVAVWVVVGWAVVSLVA
jgi:hypothetical protein